MKFSSIALMSALMVANPAAYAWVAHPPLTTSFSSSRPSFPSRFRTPGRTTATPSSSSSLSSSLGEESAAAVDTRQMYLDWCNYHGKIPSEDRYPIFAQNFMTQWRYDQSTTNVANTSYTSVNEFADWTVEEFQQRLDQIEARIKQIYQEWCQTYGKTQQAENQQKYQTFKDNFLQNMKHYEQTGDFYQLNQFADLTLEEYQAAATTGDQDGAGLPSYLQGMVQPATATTTEFTPPIAVSTSSLTPAGPPDGPSWSTAQSAYQEPTLDSQPPQAMSLSSFEGGAASNMSAGAGMPSYTDALSRSSNLPGATYNKATSYMPQGSYKSSTGSGMPSYFDNLVSSTSPQGVSSSSYYEPPSPPPMPPPTISSSFAAAPAESSKGAGMASYTNALSGEDSIVAAPKPASYMPKKSNKPSSGSGMPSYMDSLKSTSAPKSYMPGGNKAYKQPTIGSGMPSYANSMNSIDAAPAPASWSPAQPAYQEPTLESQPPQAVSLSSYEASALTAPSDPTSSYSSTPPTGAGMASYIDALSATGASSKEPVKPASYMPKSYKKTFGSGMSSYADSMKVTSSKSASYLPGKSGQPYRQSSLGSGMPSYFNNLPSTFESLPAIDPPASPPQYIEATPPLDIRPNVAVPVAPPASPAANSGSGMASYLVPSDQSTEFRRQHIPTKGGPARPLAHKMQNPQVQTSDQALEFVRRRRVEASSRNLPLSEFPLAHALKNPQLLKSDQHLIMREGEAFLPHSMEPVIRRGNNPYGAPGGVGFFFSGPLSSFSETGMPAFRKGTARFPSDQEKADVFTRQRLMYFQKGPNVGRVGGSTKDKQSGPTTSGETRRSLPMKKSSFMPTSYKETSGTGMPSYFDNF